VDFLLVLIELFSLGVTTEALRAKIDRKLEMRSVERGICPIATSIMNELFQELWPDALRMREKAVFPLPV